METILKNSLLYLEEIMEIPSPVGYTFNAVNKLQKKATDLGFETTINNKGALIITIPGKSEKSHKLITAHIDTLGGVVKEIKSNGRLRLVPTGGFAWGAFEGENVTVHTFNEQTYSGTLLPNKASVHIYGDEVRNAPREAETMEVRLDQKTNSKEETIDLGIAVGDFVSFEPRLQILDNGFIKSRFLDDKVCVAILLAYCKYIKDNQITPDFTTYFYISNYEEIGHGVSYISKDIDEMIALDIGTVGTDQESTEYDVCIAAKDSRTPYDYEFRKKLVNLCIDYNIPYIVDVFNRYGSDASTSILQGADVKFACFGPGIDATHHYERCHVDSLKATISLLGNYMFKDLEL